MAIYRIFLASGHVDLEADMVREVDNYEKGISDNQQPCVCFYKGQNPTMDREVGRFVLKNIGGYINLDQMKQIR